MYSLRHGAIEREGLGSLLRGAEWSRRQAFAVLCADGNRSPRVPGWNDAHREFRIAREAFPACSGSRRYAKSIRFMMPPGHETFPH